MQFRITQFLEFSILLYSKNNTFRKGICPDPQVGGAALRAGILNTFR